MSCTRDWEAGEVGSAYLFEKLRGKTEREAIKDRRLHEAIPDTSDSGNSEPKLQCTASDGEGEKLKLRPIQESSDSYAPNSSRRRRRLCTDSVEALQNRPEGIELVGKQEVD
jgi:hypothetical protein